MLFVQKYSTQVIAIVEGYESTSPDFQFRHYKALYGNHADLFRSFQADCVEIDIWFFDFSVL